MKLDEYHAHEALDRACLFAETVETSLLDHPYVRAHPEIFNCVSKAVSELHAAYQLIGAKSL